MADVAAYETSFPLTETTLSEGGIWVNGATTGLLWKDMRTTAGTAYGTQTTTAPSGPPYDDSLAIIDPAVIAFPANHGARCRILINPGGYIGAFHEQLLLGRWRIATNLAYGYEFNYAHNGDYAEIGLWTIAGGGNGGGPGYNSTPAQETGLPPLDDGDILELTCVGNVIRGYRNSSLVVQYTDTSTGGGALHTSGQPGIGQWRRQAGGTPTLPPYLQVDLFEAFSL